MNLTIARRDPGAGYLDNWLWIPKRILSPVQVAGSLSYVNERKGEVVEAWRETEHHWLVPRSFLAPDRRRRMPFPIYDIRFTGFPRVDLKSSFVPDVRNPSSTYQRESVEALLKTTDGVLCLRCGAGKTGCALHAAVQLHVPILILVDDLGLAEQWCGEITKFLGIPRGQIGRCGEGKFDWKHDITVATLHSIASRSARGELPPELIRYFGVVIVDEVHVIGAPYFNTAIHPFHGRRWGLSATPTREDGFDSLLLYTMGRVVFTYLMPELKPHVVFRRLPTKVDLEDPDVRKAVLDCTNEVHLFRLYGYLATVKARTDQMAKDIQALIDQGRTVLVLSHSRAMCDSILRYFPNGGVTYGGVRGKDHERIVRECNPLIAIMKRGKQALDKPSLDTVFLCDPFTKHGVIQQTMGRILRSLNGKKQPLVIFFEDWKIRETISMCGKIRRTLNRWPHHMGGAIKYEINNAAA